MLQSKLFYKTLKKAPRDAKALSHQLLTRAGFIDQLTAGVYTFLPLGFKVLKKIENIIREEMIAVNGQELLMPALNPKENWQKTGRWDSLDILFKLKGAGGREYALGPTHEEVIAPLVKKIVFSYKDLPFYLFHIQNKFRNELRAKSGLLRTREFLMKDLYSFHTDEKDLEKYYQKVADVYFRIFKRCGIYSKGADRTTYQVLASGSSFSKYSHEYQTVSQSGEDIIYICKKCYLGINKEIKKGIKACPDCKSSDFERKKAVEVGNIFKLGARYSLPFDLKYQDEQGKEKPVVMGCYGIGLSRLMAAVAEINNDKNGIIWPKETAPYDIHLIQVENNQKVRKEAGKVYQVLQVQGIEVLEVLYDDREDKSAGEKFAEADLIGIPTRIVISLKTLEKDAVELKKRKEKKTRLVKIKNLSQFLMKTEIG